MSIARVRNRSTRAVSSRSLVYRRSFERHVHSLIASAYRALNSASLHTNEETDITGRLVAAINDVLNSRGGPRWKSQFCVKDDPPVGRKGGRSRSRVDIEFERTSPLPRPHFRFEAKRLRSSKCVGLYLGAEGLRCFISRKYAGDDATAGMLGYVQVADVEQWKAKIQSRLRNSGADYQMRPIPAPWASETVIKDRAITFSSVHSRKRSADITISHTLLRFY